MENVTKRFNPNNMKVNFDLKGSTFNREFKLKSNFWIEKLNHREVLKDINFIQISKALGSKLISLSE